MLLTPPPKKTEPKDEGFDLEDLNRLPLKSKKFLAYLISEVGWKCSLFGVLYLYRAEIDYYAFFLLLAIVVTNGFLQIGYILGEVALDKYSRVAVQAVKGRKQKGEKWDKVVIDEEED
jgi:hypothetical protein